VSPSEACVASPSSGSNVSMSVRDVFEGLVDVQRLGVSTGAVATLCSSNQSTTIKHSPNAFESLGNLIASGGIT
jgi:hypothetical protein